MARALILDSEAVSALVEKRRGAAELLAAAQAADHRVLIPTVVLAEVATGAASDAAVWHVLGRIPSIELTSTVAMHAGTLRARAAIGRRKKRDLTVDAIVAATAVARAPSVVVTADPADLALLLDGFDVRVTVV